MTTPASSRRSVAEPAALELLEEAVHLLRLAPAGTLAIYYAGSVPFVLAGLFFWARTTWFQPDLAAVAWDALGLVALFVVMKAAQAEFCGRLLAQRLGVPPPVTSVARLARLALVQLRVQPWMTLAFFPALVLIVPFGWVYAYGQSATVLGDAARLRVESADQAKLWPAQNHVALLVLLLFGLCAWANLAAAFYLMPSLADRFLGIDHLFGLSGLWFFNTTFFASVTALTWLALDPLVRAFYTLRVFYGRALRTGEDLRLELQADQSRPWARRAGTGVGVAAAVLLALALSVSSPRLRAADAATTAGRPPATAPAVAPAALDRAIDGVLAGSEFQWRLPPTPEKAQEQGPIGRFIGFAAETLRNGWEATVRAGQRFLDWWDRHVRFSNSGSSSSGRSAAAPVLGLVRLLLYTLIAVGVGLMIWFAVVLWRRSRETVVVATATGVPAAAAPDLADENLDVARLPANGWLELARAQAANGEWRLALRALYLATLSRLADERLLTLARFKTNLDYERELRRRAAARTEVVSGFTARRRQFEGVWYGNIAPAEAEVRDWLAELERPLTP